MDHNRFVVMRDTVTPIRKFIGALNFDNKRIISDEDDLIYFNGKYLT